MNKKANILLFKLLKTIKTYYLIYLKWIEENFLILSVVADAVI